MARNRNRGAGGPVTPPPSVTPAEVYMLGGRRFVEVGESTVEHDDWFMTRREQVGLDVIEKPDDEDPELFARRLLSQARPVANELIGCLIVPEGKSGLDWTPEMALETAGFLRDLHTPEDKRIRDSLICSMFIHFFADGLSYLVRSRGSSAAQPDAAAVLGGPTASDDGARSFAPSHAETSSAQSG